MEPQPRRPPDLPDELIEEVLLHPPPDDPATLVSAALVCQCWRRLISGATFRRGFRDLHPSPPMLGFLYPRGDGGYRGGKGFFPTTSSSSRPPRAARDGCRMLDAGHGRVLALDHVSTSDEEAGFVVWDPLSGETHRLPRLRSLVSSWDAALVCATPGCDGHHHDRRRVGPFLVVVAATHDQQGLTSVWRTYSEINPT